MTRHTKIVATVGPASDSEQTIADLVAAGVDVFRLNFSHGAHESHARMVERIRAAARKSGRTVAVLQDLGGPKIRTGRLAGGRPIALKEGDHLRIEAGDGEGGPGRLFTTFDELAASLRPNDRLLLDDGRIELEVMSADAQGVDTVVVNGGSLGEQKGINAPGVTLAASALTPKDRGDLAFGVTLGMDFIALSFVQAAADVVEARQALEVAGAPRLPIIAKIERPAAVEHIDEILEVSDGVMVARGDLGLEVPLERVPRIQKDIARRARVRGLPVIVATQVLESMRAAPRPTRAEVSDAATAVDQGVDAIMLAGETAVGAFPARAVRTLDAIIRDAESLPAAPPRASERAGDRTFDPTLTGHGRAICEAAITLAYRGAADAIVAVTRGGKTARLLSALRPQAPVYAATDNEAVARRLALSWGVVPLVCRMGDAALLQREIAARGALSRGSVVVFVSVSPDLSRSDANFLNLQKL
jgi:pyruvate kinase